MGQVSYLIGIQESREEGHDDVPDAVDGGGNCSGTGVTRDCLPSLPENSSKVLSHQSHSSFSSSDGEEADMYVWVDAASTELTVLGSSSSFALLAGPRPPCSALAEWLGNSDRRRVMFLVRDREAVARELSVQLIHEKWSYRCRLSISDAQNPPAAPSSSKPVCLVIRGMACRPSKPPRGINELWARWETSSGGRVNKLNITRVLGDSTELVCALHANPRLDSWQEDTDGLLRALNPFFAAIIADEKYSLPCMLGKFTFTNPRQCSSPMRFVAYVTLTEFCEDGNILHFGFRKFRMV
jgi:hypothetical protein